MVLNNALKQLKCLGGVWLYVISYVTLGNGIKPFCEPVGVSIDK
jgi:hypothetical protein